MKNRKENIILGIVYILTGFLYAYSAFGESGLAIFASACFLGFTLIQYYFIHK